MLLNYACRDVLYSFSTIQDYVQGALRKKQLIASFVKHFTENDGITTCTVFQFHNPKLRQEGLLNRMSTMQDQVEGAL